MFRILIGIQENVITCRLQINLRTINIMGAKIWFYRCCFTTSILVGLTIIVVSGFLLNGLIQQQAEEGVKMTQDTYQLWGVIPGDTKTFTVRNFTIFNFTNPQDFIYKPGTKPNFVEVGGFLYQEKSQFLNVQYTPNKEFIDFDYWLYFDLLKNSKDINQKYTLMNVGPLGFWMQLQTAPLSTFALQGLGGLFVQMNATIKAQAIGQGISSTFLPTFDQFASFCVDLGFNKEQISILWNDTELGLMDQNHYQPWVQAALYSDQSSTITILQQFYPIPAGLIIRLIGEIKIFAESVEEIINHWYCGDADVCSNYDLTIKQIATGGVTGNPPPGSDAEPSICSTNITCIGSPEISYFLHSEFKKVHPDQKYQKLTFSQQWLAPLLTPYKNLLNIGFLIKVFTNGQAYDKSGELTYLQNLQDLLKTESIDHTFVIWEWLKYFTKQFVIKETRGGSRKIAGLGGVFSQAIYESSYAFASWYLQDIYSFMAYQKIGQNCQSIMNQFLTSQKSQLICSQIKSSSLNDYPNYYTLIQPCLISSKYEDLAIKYGLQRIEMGSYCDMDEQPSNIGLITLQITNQLNKWHNCSEIFPKNHCSEKDIIIKQIFNSEITMNPFNGYPFPSSNTANVWNTEIPTFEYQKYLEISGEEDQQEHKISEIQDLFSFDKLLNGPAVQELFMEKNDTQFTQKYHWNQPYLLRNYIRFVVIEVGFGGITQQRSAKQVFFGYQDPFLAQLRDTDTMAGGDPSISPFIAFNQVNMTKEEAIINTQRMNTGIIDPQQYRQFASYFNKTYIAVNQTFYDGESVKWNMVTPWAQEVPLQGSDGFSVPPNINKQDKPSVYISSIARFAKVSAKEKTIKKYGFELYDMRIDQGALQSKYENPQNQKYFQTFTGFMNQSYQGFPLFAGKNHFLDAEKKWAQRVTIVDLNGNIMTANDWDDTKLYIEPKTGAAFSATVYLQSNFYYVPDILYPEHQKVNNSSTEEFQKMLPIVNTFRSGNISRQGVDKYWGDLRMLKNGDRIGVLFGISFCAFTFIVWLAWKVHIISEEKSKLKPSLLEQESQEEVQ